MSCAKKISFGGLKSYFGAIAIVLMLFVGVNGCSSNNQVDDQQGEENGQNGQDGGIDLGRMIRCDGELIDPNTNPMYCGASGENCEEKGSICEPGTSCQYGTCKQGCIEGQVLCDGKCIVPESDNIYCGASGDKCENKGEACGHGTSCQDGKCVQGCVSGQVLCGGKCIMPETDNIYCGASGDCTGANKGEACGDGSSCQDGTCQQGCVSGQILCNGQCITPGTSNLYCGAKGNCTGDDKTADNYQGEACSDGTSCKQGSCQQGCIAGQILCNGHCITPGEDNTYCGAKGNCTGDDSEAENYQGEACGDGTSCKQGSCQQGCVAGQVLCNGQCIVPGTDNQYCGASGDCAEDRRGEACGDGTSCKQGTCQQGCVAGQILCNGQCITPGEDNTYCGAKGNCTGDDIEADDYQGEACGDGTSCKGGVCKQGCIAGQILCNGQCVTPGTSNLYCGAKGNCTGDDKEADDYQGEACGDGTSCKGGVCKQGCVAGQILCNGECITPGISNLYCGAKGNCTGDDKEADDYQGEACGDGTSCKQGSCQQGCVASQVLCNGQCIVPGTDNQYCGASGDCAEDRRGEACGDGTSCKGGVCKQGCVAGQVLCDGQCIVPGTDNQYCGASGDCTGDNKGKACEDGTSCKGGVCQQGCIAGQILCDGKCITPGTDNQYCGASGECRGANKGEACGDGTSCKQGSCQQGCVAGQVLCDGKCIVPGTDNQYCGASGDCSGDKKGEACGDGTSCKGGVCKQGCVAGQVLCDGQCIVPSTDNQYCGASGDCKGSNKGTACGDGTSCKQGTCQQGCIAGQILCDGKCITPGTDNQYCGASGDCKGENKGEACGDGTSCKQGSCQQGCVAGQVLCDGQCIVPGTDNQYCGASGDCKGNNKGTPCGDGTSCKQGTCQQGCIAGQILCDGKCITPGTDNLYCGASGDCTGNNKGTACGDGTSCKQGSCQQGCVAGQVLCDGQCIVPGTDNQYCGASGDCTGNNKGEACGDGTSCKGGVCKQGCIAGQILCDGKCITSSTDNLYCGASGDCKDANKGQPCGDGTSCKQGSCQQGCVADQVLCDGQCIVPGTDNLYCGASGDCKGENRGEACGDGTSCKQGRCQQGCIAGQILCDGKCITPSTDNLYCGATGDCKGSNKGEACGDGTSCKGGKCQQGCVAGQILCDGQCITPGTDNLYCGASDDCKDSHKGDTCEMGTSCKGGTCQQGCIAGQILCDGQCITPGTDNIYCGASGDCKGSNKGQTCGDGTSCKGGTCQPGCVAGQVLCEGTCITPGTDNQFCGATGDCKGSNKGQTCGDGTSCKGGVCKQGCVAGQVLCDNKCITPGTDMTYCGASSDCTGNNRGQTCADGYSCKAGVCKEGCLSGQILCNHTCISSLTDMNYCGAKGTCSDSSSSSANYKGQTCESGYSCQNGVCKLGCTVGTVACGGACIKPLEDNTYCGAKGTCNDSNSASANWKGQTCAQGLKCIQGQCKKECGQNESSCTINNQEGCFSASVLVILNRTSNCSCKSGYVEDNNGACVCANGYHAYNNTCEQDTTSNCGVHGLQCNVANATNTCTNGKCQFECNAGYELSNNTCVPGKMKSIWKVTSDNLTVTFPTQGRNGEITIDWGDGSANTTISSGSANYVSHTYASAKRYTITVTGKIEAWSCSVQSNGCGSSYCSELEEIQSYGNTTFGNYTFCRAQKLVKLPTNGTPRFVNNQMIGTFWLATSFNQDINFWDTSNITSMERVFLNAKAFNQSLNNWDTSNVTKMTSMFNAATAFNQSLNDWDTSNVTSMENMFSNATAFNQSLNNWDTSKVTNMMGMFSGATAFNQSLNNWDTSNVTNMMSMFSGATAFNQALNKWNVSNVKDMSYMFSGATSFNQSLNNWDTSKVTSMSYMFSKASSFNQALNNWDTSNVTNMSGMFYNATSFNQVLDKWNVSNVVDMEYMFSGATSFNQALDKWNVSKVTSMDDMFWNSGLNRANYCKLFAGAYASIWNKFKSDFELSYSCP